MEINVIDKKIDELFDKLEKNIKELDKENLKKHLKNLQETEKEYNNKAKLLDLEMKSYKEKMIQLKSESFQHIEDVMSETTKIIDSYVKTENGLVKKDIDNFKAELYEVRSVYNNDVNNRIIDIQNIGDLIGQFEKRIGSYDDIIKIQNNINIKFNEKDLVVKDLEENLIEIKEKVIRIVSTVETWENRRNLDNNEIGIFISKNNEQIERLNKANESSQKQIQDVNKYINELKSELDFLKKDVRDKNKIIEETILNNKQGLGDIIKKMFVKS